MPLLLQLLVLSILATTLQTVSATSLPVARWKQLPILLLSLKVPFPLYKNFLGCRPSPNPLLSAMAVKAGDRRHHNHHHWHHTLTAPLTTPWTIALNSENTVNVNSDSHCMAIIPLTLTPLTLTRPSPRPLPMTQTQRRPPWHWRVQAAEGWRRERWSDILKHLDND